MTKSEDKAEKRIISELWKKTEKDDNEYGALLLDGKIVRRVRGDENQIDESDWSKVVYHIYDNPKLQFDFYHTHSEWDSPLSWNDIATFLYIRNLHSMTAITEEHKYTVTRTEDTPVIDYEKREEVIEKAISYLSEEEVPTSLKKPTASLPPTPNDLYFFYFDAQREAMCDVIRRLAREYNFTYKEEEQKNNGRE